ncbi:hypothetical protein BDZ89DRAFT_1135398 [Hymenopellis radicata]|nr:hypothetical protein BDZ89DRAFT_1135398 [Hymenopellis radicata]
MEGGDLFLLGEISLADDSVLEPLNSVLESSRTMVLAEKGGDHASDAAIAAADAFNLVATMNPGGDYGKKELSPALRNRFTKIWAPFVDNRVDLELIAWVDFSNRVFANGQSIPGDIIFHHAAHMTYIDGLASMPQLSGYSKDAIMLQFAPAGEAVPAAASTPVQRSPSTPTATPAAQAQRRGLSLSNSLASSFKSPSSPAAPPPAAPIDEIVDKELAMADFDLCRYWQKKRSKFPLMVI